MSLAVLSKTPEELDLELAEQIAEFYDDPLGYVLYVFSWDTDPALQVVDWENEAVIVDWEGPGLEGITGKPYYEVMKPYRERFPNVRFGPDLWACQFLDELGREIRKRGFDGVNPVAPIQFATSSGHGIGKTTLTAWLIKFIFDTRPYSKGTVTANTADQLRTKTWAELGKWHKRSLTSHWATYSSGRGNMALRHVRHPEEWYCVGQTCREENSEAFAGQHAANSTSYYIFDEASAVPDKIFEVREGGTTDGEPMTFDFGNPTRNSGRFFEECRGRFRHRYIVREIDSRTVSITNKDRLREWIEDYGYESDFVKVRVLGQFPDASSLQFIRTDYVLRAMGREIVVDRQAPLVIGVDVARFGDDNSVIYPRIGSDAASFAPVQGDGIYQGLDNVQLAQKVMQTIERFRALGIEYSMCAVDVTGVGAGVVDILTHSGYNVVPVNFGTTPVIDPETYRYRSDEMWGRMRDAIRDVLVLPKQPDGSGWRRVYVEDEPMSSIRETEATSVQLLADLTQREFGYTLAGNKIHLETKRDMKARGVPSPDIADALALTYAQDVARASLPHGTQHTAGTISDHDYDPLENVSVY